MKNKIVRWRNWKTLEKKNHCAGSNPVLTTMKNRQAVLLLIVVFVFGFVLSYALWAEPKQTNTTQVDTPVVLKPVDTVISVKGKKALFIGDSHTAFSGGWQHQVAKKTGMMYLNTAVGGKQTAWMLETARLNMSSNYDYCFIYGGANDMASNRPPMKSVKNIQRIVDLCKTHGVKAVVITGFDPLTCVNVAGRDQYKGYPQRYARFQQMSYDGLGS